MPRSSRSCMCRDNMLMSRGIYHLDTPPPSPFLFPLIFGKSQAKQCMTKARKEWKNKQRTWSNHSWLRVLSHILEDITHADVWCVIMAHSSRAPAPAPVPAPDCCYDCCSRWLSPCMSVWLSVCLPVCPSMCPMSVYRFTRRCRWLSFALRMCFCLSTTRKHKQTHTYSYTHWHSGWSVHKLEVINSGIINM